MNNINLLSQRNSELLRQEKKIRKARIIAVGFLAFVAVTSIAAFFLNRSFSLSLAKKEEDRILQERVLLSKKEAKLVLVNDRLKSITDILNTRTQYGKTITGVLRKIPEGISIERLEIGKENLNLTFSSTSLFSVNIIINNLLDMARRKEVIENLTLESVNLNDKTGVYTATVKAGF